MKIGVVTCCKGVYQTFSPLPVIFSDPKKSFPSRPGVHWWGFRNGGLDPPLRWLDPLPGFGLGVTSAHILFAKQLSSSWELCFLSLKHCTQTHRSGTTIRDRSSFDPFWPHFYDDQLIKKGFEFCYWYEWCYAWLAHFQQLWSGSLKIGIRQSITTILIVFCSERSCLFQKSCSSAW